MSVRNVLKAAGRIAMAGVFIKGGWDAFQEPGGRPKMAAASDFRIRTSSCG